MAHSGSCLCGAVTYTLKARPETAGACHCSMCRKFSGGVYIAMTCQPDNITFTGQGQIGTYTSSTWAERGFCRTCGSSLYYRVTAEGPYEGTYHLAFGTLDDSKGMGFEGEIFVDQKPDLYDFVGNHSRMTEAEFMKSMGIE